MKNKYILKAKTRYLIYNRQRELLHEIPFSSIGRIDYAENTIHFLLIDSPNIFLDKNDYLFKTI
jgi:hypothetical protein